MIPQPVFVAFLLPLMRGYGAFNGMSWLVASIAQFQGDLCNLIGEFQRRRQQRFVNYLVFIPEMHSLGDPSLCLPRQLQGDKPCFTATGDTLGHRSQPQRAYFGRKQERMFGQSLACLLKTLSAGYQ